MSFEVDPGRRNRGLGRLLVAPARRAAVRAGRPGNAASLRVVEAAGFRPVGAEVLFHRDGADPS